MINSFYLLLDYNENPYKFDFIIEQSRQLFVIQLNTIVVGWEIDFFYDLIGWESSSYRLWKEESFCYERI